MTVCRTVPTLTWNATEGTLAGASVIRQGLPEILSGDMSLLSGYVEVRLDEAKAELGEGFEITVTDTITVSAGTETGLYRGQVAAAQLLAFNDEIPRGSATSVAARAERGVTVSASTVIFSEDWCRWLLDTMALCGLNTLLLEAKIEDEDRRLNTWPYWTRDQINLICTLARERHIDVIPEVNSPGHMATLLHYYPQYAVRRADGSIDTERLDIGSPAAIDFYLDLVDRYLDVFDSDWWHMGADEYEYHSITYDHFPSLFEAARAQYGEDGHPTDLFVAFINTVNAHVKNKGKRLRIWNDGIVEPNIVELDPDVRIEYWLTRGLTPTQLVERGYQIMNAAQYLYWSRSVRDVYGVDCADIYDTKIDLAEFDDGSRVTRGVTGAKLSIWPDMAYAQTENEIILEVRDSLLLTAEGCWNAARPELTWDEFRDIIDTVAPYPQFATPITGSYHIPALDDLEEGPWLIEPTYDGYVTITAPSGKRLATGEGREVMGVVMEVGSPVVLAEPEDMSVTWLEGQGSAKARNTQKWSVTGTDRLIITAALSGLTIGDLTIDHVDLDDRDKAGIGLVPPGDGLEYSI